MGPKKKKGLGFFEGNTKNTKNRLVAPPGE